MSGLVLPPSAVLRHVDAVEKILQQDKSVEERTDEADRYMTGVLEESGRRVYEAVLATVAAAKDIPPKGEPR